MEGCCGCGFQMMASMPPIRARRKPMNNPPTEPTQLSREKTMIKAPVVAWLPGSEFNLEAKKMMSTPHTMPRIPIIPPIPPNMNVTAAPMAATMIPPMTTKMPPTSDKMYAPVGFSVDICFLLSSKLLFNGESCVRSSHWRTSFLNKQGSEPTNPVKDFFDARVMAPEMSARDADVVRTIEEEGLSVFTFDGLRRITGTHPETLSRSLERLEDDGYVVKSPEGYSVTDKVKESFAVRPAYSGARRVPILHTFLPYEASAGTILTALKGRWFDTIRWVGMAEIEDGFVMKWVTDDGSALIDAKFSAGQLDIDAKVAEESDLPKAVRAAHQLMGRISRLYSSQRPGSKLALMRMGYFTPHAM